MPDKKGRLNRQEQRFVETYVKTGDATYSATKAGYSSPQPRGAQNLSKPAIQQEIRRQQMERLHNKLLPLTFDHFERTLSDPGAPLREKTMIGRTVLDACRKISEDMVTKDVADMTAEELENARQQLFAELALRSRPVIEPIAPPAPELAETVDDAGVFD